MVFSLAGMTRRKQATPGKRPAFPVPLLLLLAFVLGMGSTWLVSHKLSPAPTKAPIESFLPPTNGGASGLTQPAPPDVSGMPPAEAARTLANWNYDREDWSHAVEHYQEAIARGADTPDVRTDLGNCFRFLNQPQKALEQYEVAQKQNPLHENSLFNQASLFAQVLHDHARANSAAREFLARFPASPQAAAAKQFLLKGEGNGGGGASPQ